MFSLVALMSSISNPDSLVIALVIITIGAIVVAMINRQPRDLQVAAPQHLQR